MTEAEMLDELRRDIVLPVHAEVERLLGAVLSRVLPAWMPPGSVIRARQVLADCATMARNLGLLIGTVAPDTVKHVGNVRRFKAFRANVKLDRAGRVIDCLVCGAPLIHPRHGGRPRVVCATSVCNREYRRARSRAERAGIEANSE